MRFHQSQAERNAAPGRSSVGQPHCHETEEQRQEAELEQGAEPAPAQDHQRGPQQTGPTGCGASESQRQHRYHGAQGQIDDHPQRDRPSVRQNRQWGQGDQGVGRVVGVLLRHRVQVDAINEPQTRPPNDGEEIDLPLGAKGQDDASQQIDRRHRAPGRHRQMPWMDWEWTRRSDRLVCHAPP